MPLKLKRIIAQLAFLNIPFIYTAKALAIAVRTIAIAIVAKKAIEYCNMQ